jgi:hypothetical protein
MTQIYPADATGGARRDGEGAAAAPDMAHWLSLTAAPTFAIMALLTAAFDGEGAGTLCLGRGGWPFGGMVPMYLLMSAFHMAPWLRLISGGRAKSAGPDPALALRKPPAPSCH